MSSDHHRGPWFTEQQAMLVLALLAVVLAGLVIVPYLQYVILALIFAYLLWPLRNWLMARLRPNLTALVLTIGSILAVMIPIAYLLFQASREALGLIDRIEAGEIHVDAIEEQLAALGVTIDLDALYDTYRGQIGTALETVAWSVFDTVRSIPRMFFGLTITVFVLFVLLRDGEKLLAWVRSVLPINHHIQDELNERLDRLTRASVIGNVAASLIQAVALGIGLWLLGFDNVIFLSVLTFILALLPLVGAFLVWVPLVLYLVALGSLTTAAILLVYGTIVSLSDFYTRPIVIGHSAALNSAVIVVGVFGGIVAFGGIGLLIGPVILGGAKIAVEVLVRERNSVLDDTTPA